jgi:Domain of unknown function (DUF4440)
MNRKNGRPATVLAVILLSLFTAPVRAAQGPDAAANAVAKSLIAKEKSSWTLAIKKDAAAYKALHARNFLTVSETGVTGRARSEASALDANVIFDKCALSQMHVHWMRPDVALITYHARFAGTDHGKSFTGDQYASSLWVRSGAEWLNAFYQATPSSKQ